MEVNPRLSQSVEVAVRAGVDFPRMQLEWARGGETREVPSYAVGMRLGWLAGDMRVLAAAATRRPPRPPLWSTVSAFVKDYVLRRVRIEGFDIHDPKPMVGALMFAARAGRHLTGRAPTDVRSP